MPRTILRITLSLSLSFLKSADAEMGPLELVLCVGLSTRPNVLCQKLKTVRYVAVEPSVSDDNERAYLFFLAVFRKTVKHDELYTMMTDLIERREALFASMLKELANAGGDFVKKFIDSLNEGLSAEVRPSDVVCCLAFASFAKSMLLKANMSRVAACLEKSVAAFLAHKGCMEALESRTPPRHEIKAQSWETVILILAMCALTTRVLSLLHG